jgi:hypothetical protein
LGNVPHPIALPFTKYVSLAYENGFALCICALFAEADKGFALCICALFAEADKGFALCICALFAEADKGATKLCTCSRRV